MNNTKQLSPVKKALAIIYIAIELLKPFDRNSRTHTNHQIHQIVASIKEFGWTIPILIDQHNKIIAGHARIAAAKLLGIKEVPAIRVEDLTEDQIRAYAIADNRLAENAGWDKEILAIEFQHLLTIPNFDVTITGFEITEVDLTIQEAKGAPDQDDELPAKEAGPAVTKPGDVWQLNEHRVLCGNSLREESFRILLGRRRVAIVFIDPPYNVRIDGNVCGKGFENRFFASSRFSTERAILAKTLDKVDKSSDMKNPFQLVVLQAPSSAHRAPAIDLNNLFLRCLRSRGAYQRYGFEPLVRSIR